MRHRPYDFDEARALHELLCSIATELVDREVVVASLEDALRVLETGRGDERQVLGLRADLAEQRREIRRVHDEIEWLGCSVIEDDPLTIRVPTRLGRRRENWVWKVQPTVTVDLEPGSAPPP